MSCNITYGFANVCLTVGGIKELYIAQYDKNLYAFSLFSASRE